jgi:hypothetical protein
MKRRDLLLSSGGAAAVLLSGRVPKAQAQQTTTQELVEIETALDLVPAPSELDAEYGRITETTVEATSRDELTYEAAILTQFEEIDIADVDSVATATTDDGLSVGAILGSFGTPKPGEQVDEIGGWRIGDSEDDRRATASTDGMLAFASAEDSDVRIDAAETAQEVGVGGTDSAVDGVETLSKAFDRLGDKSHFYYITDLQFASASLSEQIQTFSAGFEESPSQIRGMQGTFENAYLLEAADGVDLDDDAVKEILQELEQGTLVELETEYDDGFAYVETVVEAPPRRAREAAPDASVGIKTADGEGTVTLTHRSGESIPAEMLELWVNGAMAETQPADEFETFTEGDSLTVDTGPLAVVYLRWFDEEANEYFAYVNEAIGRNSFEKSYDPSTKAVEMTYTGEMDAETDRLALTVRRRVDNDEDDNTYRYETEQLTAPIEELGDTLTTGDSLTVEDAGIGDRVELRLDVPQKPASSFGPDRTLVRYRIREPRISVMNRGDKGLTLRYYDDIARDAENFRVLADDEETQPADEHDTLERGDEISLPDVEYGTKIVVEWTAGDETTVIEEIVITPRVYMNVSYDDEEGTVTLTHQNGEEVDASNLKLTFNDEAAETQFSDEYDTVSQGDSLSVDGEPFQEVKVVWTDGETEETITQRVTGRDLFQASYDPSNETIELAYTGQQTADASNLEVRRYSRDADNENDENPFSDIETLSNGDSVTLEDVGPETSINVVVTTDDRRWSTVYRFSAQPRYAFNFENREGTLVATYREDASRDASEFRFLADGEELDTQPGEEYDTLEEGDELELGSFEAGTTIVIEWPTSGDATQVQEYTVVPDASFAVSYDSDEGVLSIEHNGGDEIDADSLGVYAPPATEGLADWDGDGTVSEGDSMTIEAEEKPDNVLLIYNEGEVIDRTNLSE